MEKFILVLFAFFVVSCLQAQLNVYIDPATKDSIISTPFDTLTTAKDTNGNVLIVDKVVAIRNIHRKDAKYWLFFYFLPTDADKKELTTVKKSNYAYFGLDDGTYLRVPYNGKTYTYKYPQLAGFFVDISSYLAKLKNAKLRFIRLETSNLYHEIPIKEADNYRIATLLKSLN